MVKYQRILIKFSGEAFGQKGRRVNLASLKVIANELKSLVKAKVKVAVVVGGGNVARGREASKTKRVITDVLGIKATLKNILALAKALASAGVKNSVYTSFSLVSKYPKFSGQALKNYQQGRVVLLAGGTGYPFFSTDTASVLRSLQLSAELFIKATKVDGVYSADPLKNPQAKKFNALSYKNVIIKKLSVIDRTAVSLAWENSLPIRVIKWQEGNVIKAVKGENLGSLII